MLGHGLAATRMLEPCHVTYQNMHLQIKHAMQMHFLVATLPEIYKKANSCMQHT